MKCAAIHRPSESTLSMIKRKSYDKALHDAIEAGMAESIGICQGSVLEIIVASDIAEKTSELSTVVDDNESLVNTNKENTDKLDSVLSMFKH